MAEHKEGFINMVVLYNTKAEKGNINNFGDFPSIQIITHLHINAIEHIVSHCQTLFLYVCPWRLKKGAP